MKKNALLEIRAETVDKLVSRLAKEKKELADLYLEMSIKKIKNPRSLFHKRKDISQIMTVLNEKKKKL